jgi:hypothetical protein
MGTGLRRGFFGAPSSTTATTTTTSSSSSNSSWVQLPHARDHRGAAVAGVQAMAYMASSALYLLVPVLPQGVHTPGPPSGSPSAPPVSLQQLQLVTHVLSCVTGPSLSIAGLLQALLLQRAGPAVRAEFLSSPAGSLWLDTLVSAPDKDRRCPGYPGWRFFMGLPISKARAELLAAVQGAQQGLSWCTMPAATTSLLSLAWAHLEVVQGGVPRADCPTLGMFATFHEEAFSGTAFPEPRGECAGTCGSGLCRSMHSVATAL